MRRQAWQAQIAREEATRARWAALAQRRPWRASWRSVLSVDVFVLLVMAVLAHGLFQIAFVMAASRPAPARVSALTCAAAYRSVTSDITVRYSDDSGASRTVTHANDTFGCFDQYRVGQTIPIHYSTIWPGALVTQEELDDLPDALLFWTLLVALSLSLPILCLRYPGVLDALLRRLPFRKPPRGTRYGQEIS